MKTLQQTFDKNCDGSGTQTFTQVKRDGDVCLYSRTSDKGTVIGYEVFLTHIIKAGSAMKGGGVETEDREAYPGKSAFGRNNAWFVGGVNALERATDRFDKLVKGERPVIKAEEGDDEETSIPVVKVVSATPIKEGLTLPDGPFTQKELAAFNHIDNYKQVYSDLQKMLARGILKHGAKRESTRGKSAQLFVRV